MTAPETSLVAPSVTPQRSWIGGLDGLRAIAVTLVLIYHLFPPLLPGGFLGVDIFFVISGFLITTLLLRERTERGSIRLRAFWVRRARRLLPALITVIVMSVPVALFIGGDILLRIRQQTLGALAFVSNWVLISGGTNYFTQDSPELLRNTWSLAIEEQFYIVLPIILVVLMNMRSRLLGVSVLAGLAALSALHMFSMSRAEVDPTRIYFGSDSHIFGLLLGAAAATALYKPNAGTEDEHQPRPRLYFWATSFAAVTGFSLLAYLVATLLEGSAASFEGGIQLATLAALTVIVAVTRPGAPAGRLLDWAPLAYLGQRSYGVYLWHWPVLLLVRAHLAQQPGEEHMWAAGMITLAVTLLFAALSHRFIEMPIRRYGASDAFRRALAAFTPQRVSWPSRSVVLVSVGVLLLGVPFTVTAMIVAPSVSSSEHAVERGRQALEAAESAGGRHASKGENLRSASDPDPLLDADVEHQPPSQSVAVTSHLPALQHGSDVLAIGDSVMLASAPELSANLVGIEIDAEVSRGFGYAISALQELEQHNRLRPIIVIGLGTNGPIEHGALAELDRFAKEHRIVLVNAYADRWWVDEVNDQLAEFANARRGVVIADWAGNIADHTEWLAADLVHPHAAGGELYARVIGEAIAGLSAPQEVAGFGVPRR